MALPGRVRRAGCHRLPDRWRGHDWLKRRGAGATSATQGSLKHILGAPQDRRLPPAAPEGAQDREGAALEEERPGGAGCWQQAGVSRFPKEGGRRRTGHRQPERAHGG